MSNAKTPTVKGGRVPLKAQISAADFAPYHNDESLLRIDSELEEQIKSEGLSIRWINKRKYIEAGNYHPRGWKAYRIDMDSKRAAIDFKFGVSPEGYLERDGNLLAVLPLEHHAAHKRALKEKVRRQSTEAQKNREDLKEEVRRKGGLKMEDNE